MLDAYKTRGRSLPTEKLECSFNVTFEIAHSLEGYCRVGLGKDGDQSGVMVCELHQHLGLSRCQVRKVYFERQVYKNSYAFHMHFLG